MGTQLTEAHTGYRAYSRRLLLTVPFLRNSPDFSFDSELLMQAVALRHADRGGPGATGATSRRPRRSGCGAARSTGSRRSGGRRGSCSTARTSCRARSSSRPRRGSTTVERRAVTGERVVTAERRLQPDLAAARGRLRARASRSLPPGRIARRRLRRRALATGCSRRARPSGSTSTPRPSRARTAATVAADMRDLPFADGEFDGAIVGALDRARARTPSARSPRSRGCSQPGGTRGARHAEPAHLRARPTRSSTPTTTSSTTRTQLARAVPAALRRGRAARASSARSATCALVAREHAKLDRAARAAIRCGCGGCVPRRAAPAAVRPAAEPRARGRRPRGRGDRAVDDFTPGRDAARRRARRGRRLPGARAGTRLAARGAHPSGARSLPERPHALGPLDGPSRGADASLPRRGRGALGRGGRGVRRRPDPAAADWAASERRRA